MAESIRILLADDHLDARLGLAALLSHESDMDIVGEASDGQMAVEMADKLLPDVVIMDVNMPKISGIEATRQIVSYHPNIQVIGFSIHLETNLVTAMREAGAVAYISKSDPIDALISAIHAIQPGSSKHIN